MNGVLLESTRITGGTITLGDIVKVTPSKPGGHDGFQARVRRIVENAVGDIDIEVSAVASLRARDAVRTFPPSRLRRTRREAGR